MNSEQFQNLPLSNVFMFGEVMRQENICKLFLEALLQRPIDRVVYASKEETISDELSWHGIRLDVYMKDEAGTMYNIEMQTVNRDDLPRRIRYYQGTMDRRALESGKDYRELPDSFIIFVCSFDYFGGGLAVYRRKTVLEGREDISYEDGSHVYVLNSDYQEGNTAPAILEYLRCIRENDVDYGYESELMRAVCPAIKSIRSDERKEASYVTMQMYMADERRAAREDGVREGIQKGIQKGRVEGVLDAIRGLMNTMGWSVERAMEALNVPDADRAQYAALLRDGKR